VGLFQRRPARPAKPLTRTLLVETTWRCNAACAFCYNHYAPDAPARGSEPLRPEPPTRQGRRIVATAIRGSGASQIAFTGGESTLRDDLFDLVAQARLLGASASVLTNGRNLDRAYVRDLKQVGCGLVQLTFCGVDAETHDDLCGPGAFARNVAALEALRAEGVALGLTFVLTRRNLHAAAPFLRFARDAGQRDVLLNRFNPGGRGAADPVALLPTLTELRMVLDDVDAAAAATGVRPFAAVPIMPCLVSFADYPHVTFAHGCAAGTGDAYYTIDPWGDVRFCNHTPTVLGNVLETPFADIARSPALTAFRAARPPFCAPCPGWSVCRGGCRAASQQVWGRADVEDPLLRACLDRGEVAPPDEP
jgi:radical SAM protein with 4Fe4S-binding SPASM domain